VLSAASPSICKHAHVGISSPTMSDRGGSLTQKSPRIHICQMICMIDDSFDLISRPTSHGDDPQQNIIGYRNPRIVQHSI
jgi:hypothetical protein